MTRIHVLGGTGYAGGHIARIAAARGHRVVSFSRAVPAQGAPGVDHRAGDLLDDARLRSAFDGAEVVVSGLSPRGALEGEGRLRALLRSVARTAAERGVRLGVVGGAGSLRLEPGGPRLIDAPGLPEAARPEATEMAGILDDLEAAPEPLDWFFVSPALAFGRQAPGEPTGRYCLGADVLLRDENGESAISGEDFAAAFVDEIERPAHRRRRFTVAR